MNSVSDEELFRSVQQEDSRAFTAIFNRYKKNLYQHVYKRCGNPHDTEEIVQKIFITLWKNRDTIVVEESLRPYLFGAARLAVLNYFVACKKELKRAGMLLLQAEEYVYPAEDYMITEEVDSFIKHKVNKMPETMKQVFQLSRYKGLSIQEIAAELHLSEQTVKNNLSLALKRLRAELVRLEHGVPFAIAYVTIC